MKPHLIEQKIYEIRGHKVMLDFDLAELYDVETKVLNQSVKRNILRFPRDFMFRLTVKEWNNIQLQTTTGLDKDSNRSQFVTGSQKHRSKELAPYAFTEQGVSMLSSILKSGKAISINIAIMRAFVFIRQYAITHKDLTAKLKELEGKYDKQFKDVYEALNFLLQKEKQHTKQANRRKIGFKRQNDID